jgi:hypothetical protein
LKAQLATRDSEIADLRSTQKGIITTQRQSILDGIEDPMAKVAKQAEFAVEDGKAANIRRSSELEAEKRQIAANATANSAITAEAKARELEAATGVPAQRLLDSPLVKDTAEDGTVSYDMSKMETLATDLKGAGETKGIEAVGARTPAAIAAATDDKTFLKGWGDGSIPITAENQKRADRIHKELATTV